MMNSRNAEQVFSVRARLGMRSMDCQRFGICHIEDIDCIDFSVKRGSVVMRIVLAGDKIMLHFLRKTIHADDLSRFETCSFQVGEQFHSNDSPIMKESHNFSLGKGNHKITTYQDYYCVCI